MKFFKKLKKNR